MIGDSGTGIVTSDVSAEGIRKEILRYFADPALREGCIRAIRSEKQRLSWDRFAASLTAFAKTL
jgi:glycosyltransferase involved in cell wall biosynthesis